MCVYECLDDLICACLRIYTYTYIYIVSILTYWIRDFSGSSGYLIPDEPLRRNYSRLVPDSLSNDRYYFALLSIEHFLHYSLAALTVFFSFDQPIACLLIFFSWYDKVGLFFFFPIYIFLLTVIRCIFSSSNNLPFFFNRKGYY